MSNNRPNKFINVFDGENTPSGINDFRYIQLKHNKLYIPNEDGTDQIEIGGGSPMIEISYEELKNLRDSSILIPGMQYRITDYTCITKRADIHSAEHQFDIIVVADDESTLNENARAIRNENDSYFSEANLKAWEIKYCLDNDTERFAWAYQGVNSYKMHCKTTDSKSWEYIRNTVATSSTGVFELKTLNDVLNYYNNLYNDNFSIIDENGNDLSYMLNDTLYSYYPDGEHSETAFPDFDTNKIIYSTIETNPNAENIICGCKASTDSHQLIIYFLPNMSFYGSDFQWSDESKPGGKGVIYYMKDEHNNECPYDFKNIQYYVNDKWKYTFAVDEYDDSLGTKCFGNVIKPNGNELNFIIFGDGCSNNIFGNDCQSNIFGSDCSNNTFGNNFKKNTFGNNCLSNIFGNDCQSNIFGSDCSNNTFGDNCNNITLSSRFYNNTFESDVSKLSLSTSNSAVFRMTVLSDNYNNISYTIPIIATKNFWLGLNYAKNAIQIAEGWPQCIKYTDKKNTDSYAIIKPDSTIKYNCVTPLYSLTINTDEYNRDNFKVEFDVANTFTINLPTGVNYVGTIEVESRKHYLLTHDDDGVYYIGEYNKTV